ncbi:histidinol phosphate aminotransferase [Algirhabdus cladophorae]|uniref:histidinol phosphate aminotransferase n=1 Tax=Algirhabdus cladophorae TaxID=3377108 RepID=UPI003B849D4E
MRDHSKIGHAPDFTTAFLCMAGVVLFMALTTIYAIYGFVGVALFAVAMNKWITRPKRARVRSQVQAPASARRDPR